MSLDREYDLKNHVVEASEVVVYECLFSEVGALVDLVLEDPSYRSLTVHFHGLDRSSRPICRLEVVFDIDVRSMAMARRDVP